ncbi:hypothetical protein D3C78_298090 [compost metagenome]
MSEIRLRMVNQVNSASIRIENHDGEPHIVVPSYTLPDSVIMNGGFYGKEEIDRAWPTLANTLAPIGHPTNAQGEWLSAFAPEAIHNFHGGAWNRNVRRDGHRVYAEKVVNVRYAQGTEPGRRLLAALRYNAETGELLGPEKPIHTSTGLMLVQEPAPAGSPYQWIARNMRLDHDAILLDEPGAATPEQGVGMMVNCSAAVDVANLSDDSAEQRRAWLDTAGVARWGDMAWVRDFDSGRAVFRVADGRNVEIGYRLSESGNGVELEGEEVEVAAKTSWVRRAIANFWAAVAPSAPVQPIPRNNTEGDQMDAEQLKAALAAALAEPLAAINTALQTQGAAIAQLQTNAEAQSAALKANAETQRKADLALVTKEYGEAVANAVAEDKLVELANALRTAGKSDALPGGQNNADQAQWGLVPEVK